MRFSVERARLAQRLIAERVIEKDEVSETIRLAGGVDVSYIGDLAIAAATVVDAKSFELVAKHVVKLKVEFPYIPTLLAFREAGPMVAAVQGLKLKPEVLLVDGNGRLHPLGAGIACQVGLALDMPTVGVAKKLLCGEIGQWRGYEAPVVVGRRVAGAAVKVGSKLLFVSVGHKVTLPTAVKLVRLLTRAGRSLPEPLRLAHLEATTAAKALKHSGTQEKPLS